MAWKFYRLYGGKYCDAAHRFFEARKQYRTDVLRFLKPFGTTSCLIENGKIVAVKLEDGQTMPSGWVIRESAQRPENMEIVDGWQHRDAAYMQPDKKTKVGRQALGRMKKLVEPGQGEVVQALSDGGIIIPSGAPVSIRVRMYKKCYYVAVQCVGEGPDLSGRFPDGIMEVNEDEFNWPDRPDAEIQPGPSASNQEQS